MDYSPAEMLFWRKIRTTVPVFPDQLKPLWSSLEKIRMHEEESKLTQTSRYNARHRCKELPALHTGERVWVVDQKTPAIVTEKASTPRSYMVETQAGSTIRRNRQHLIPVPEHPVKDTSVRQLERPLVDTSNSKQAEMPTPKGDAKTSRSRRVVKPPFHLNL